MLDCPCGSSQGITEEQPLCPACGMDLTPLFRLRQAIEGLEKMKADLLREKEEARKGRSLYIKGMAFFAALSLFLGIMTISMLPDTEISKKPPTDAPSLPEPQPAVVPVAQVPLPEEEPGFVYTIKPGDTLSKIAYNFYGTGSKWDTIYEANREKIANPDIIEQGTEIIIPRL